MYWDISASQTFRYKISLFEFPRYRMICLVLPLLKSTEVFAETKSFFLNKFNIDVSSLLMSSLRAMVISQTCCGNRVISSQIHLFAPLLNTRRCALCLLRCTRCTHKLKEVER